MDHTTDTNPNTLNQGDAGRYRKPKKIPAPRGWSDFTEQAKQYVESVKQYGSFHTLALGELRQLIQWYDDARYWEQRTFGQRDLYWEMVEEHRQRGVNPQEYRSFCHHYLPVPAEQAHVFDVVNPEDPPDTEE